VTSSTSATRAGSRPAGPAWPWLLALLLLAGSLLGFAAADTIRGAFRLHETRQLIDERRADMLAECLEFAGTDEASTLCLRRYADEGSAPVEP
jgi:hypothetical protein